MLVFIGLGLNSEEDMTSRGLEEARSCDVIFAEFYTSRMPGMDHRKLEDLVGRKINVLKRSDVEERGEEMIIAPAETKKVGLMVAGDPLVSTTHVHLRIDAKRKGIKTRVIHNASIFSAGPSISGLQNYRFGRSATVAIPEPGFFPETPYDAILENKKLGLHTMLFLDIKAAAGGDGGGGGDGTGQRLMGAGEAIEVLFEIEVKRKEGAFTEDTLCVVLGNVGADDCVLRAGKAGDLVNEDFGTLPHTLIVPGKLHFMEEEYLEAFGGM